MFTRSKSSSFVVLSVVLSIPKDYAKTSALKGWKVLDSPTYLPYTFPKKTHQWLSSIIVEARGQVEEGRRTINMENPKDFLTCLQFHS